MYTTDLEDLNATELTIENEEDRRDLAWGDLPGWVTIEEDQDEPYKDMATVYMVVQRESDRSYWNYSWYKHTSHYGRGEHDYNVQTKLHRLNRVEKVVTKTEVTWERVKP